MIGLTAPFGFAVLLLIAAAATLLILSGVIAYDALHPPRRTAGYAIAHGLPADPADLRLDFEAWTLDVPREVRLPVWDITTHGPGPTAVFVHGWGESRITSLGRIDPWREHARRIVLYDRRGHGDATGCSARLGTGEDRDLHALLERLGGGPFILVGHGSGASVAIAAATDAADRDIAAVVTHGIERDPHTVIQDRMQSRGLPARPLSDLAMLWLRFMGVRRRDTVKDRQDPQCPLLIDPNLSEISLGSIRGGS